MSWISHAKRGREAETLSVLEIRLHHAGGVATYDPNSIIMEVFTGKFKGLKPLAGERSIFSGQPALVLREHDLRISLTRQELIRYTAHALLPEEYFALLSRFGMDYSWHEDFYTEDEGLHFQPVLRRGTYRSIDKREQPCSADAWPDEGVASVMPDDEIRHFLVRHPLVVPGTWKPVTNVGVLLDPPSFDQLSREELLANLAAIESLREQYAPAPSAARKAPRP